MRSLALIATIFVVACGKLGPECQRLSECCEEMKEATTRAGCLETLDEHGTEDGAETYCRSAADILEQSGSCAPKSDDTDPMRGPPVSCGLLRECCQQISNGIYRSDCLLTAGQLETQSTGATSCRLAMEGFVADGWCVLAKVAGPEDSNLTCSDGVDNDANGHVDCQDFGCSRNPNVTVCRSPENQDATCRDGRDNDGDGFYDCDDYDCSRNPTVTVCG